MSVDPLELTKDDWDTILSALKNQAMLCRNIARDALTMTAAGNPTHYLRTADAERAEAVYDKLMGRLRNG